MEKLNLNIEAPKTGVFHTVPEIAKNKPAPVKKNNSRNSGVNNDVNNDIVDVKTVDESKRLREEAQSAKRISKKYFVDNITGKIGLQIIDGDSNVVKQIPPEYQMAISRYMKILSIMSG